MPLFPTPDIIILDLLLKQKSMISNDLLISFSHNFEAAKLIALASSLKHSVKKEDTMKNYYYKNSK